MADLALTPVRVGVAGRKDTYLHVAPLGAAFLVFRLDPETENRDDVVFEVVVGPVRNKRAATAAAKIVAATTGELVDGKTWRDR